MVHLAPVHKKKEGSGLGAIAENAAAKLSQLRLTEDPDEFSTSVYGSRFADRGLPGHEIPDGEMPKEIAYRMISDHLSLDGNPKLK
jgi:glutamate decarboxylase